jgi:ribonuclease BN (tRNA processing enzyme)
MGHVTLTFLGAGDAFGSGGRLQTCMLLRGGDDDLVVDFGTSSLVALKRAAVDPIEDSVIRAGGRRP